MSDETTPSPLTARVTPATTPMADRVELEALRMDLRRVRDYLASAVEMEAIHGESKEAEAAYRDALGKVGVIIGRTERVK